MLLLLSYQYIECDFGYSFQLITNFTTLLLSCIESKSNVIVNNNDDKL